MYMIAHLDSLLQIYVDGNFLVSLDSWQPLKITRLGPVRCSVFAPISTLELDLDYEFLNFTFSVPFRMGKSNSSKNSNVEKQFNKTIPIFYPAIIGKMHLCPTLVSILCNSNI